MSPPAVGTAVSFDDLLADLLARFTGTAAEDVDTEVKGSLRVLVEFLETDRASLFEFSAEDPRVYVVHTWARPGIDPYVPQNLAATTPWYHERLLQGHVIRLDRLHPLPEEAAGERVYSAQVGMRSTLGVPIAVGGRFVCALTTSAFRTDRIWSDADEARVRAVGHILANAVFRRRAEAELRGQLAEIERLRERLQNENIYLREQVSLEGGYDEIVGRSPAMQEVLAQVAQVAPTPLPVLLLGETGTGKELLAHVIHARSPRRARPLVKVNCAALAPTLVESELFGHERGAFTGATATRVGRFELADGGTLFLDEIGDLPMELQAKLLRVLQEGEFERVGASRTRTVDVRVLSATNRDLGRALAEGRFREDLYYRLAGFTIAIAPLRDRPQDIPLLAWAAINRRQGRLGRRIEDVPETTMEALVRYAWPGNVRELHNVIDRALVLSTGPVLRVDEHLLAGPGRVVPVPVAPRSSTARLDAVEREHIRRVLEQHGWRIHGKGHAAEALGLHPNTLRSRMRRLGISRPRRAS